MQRLVGLELLLGVKGGAVDPGQHLARLVAAPVGAGDRVEREGADAAGGRGVRAAAEVLEGAVAVQRDRVDALVADQVLDQLDLVVLALGAELLDRLGDGQLAPLEGLVGLHVLGHRRLDALEVLVADADPFGELEVVVEAVLDRRPDRDLGPRPELQHRLRHHVGGVVADQPQGVWALVGDDLDRLAVGERRREVAQLLADPQAESGLGEARPDRRRRVGAGRPVGKLERRAVGQPYFNQHHHQPVASQSVASLPLLDAIIYAMLRSEPGTSRLACRPGGPSGRRSGARAFAADRAGVAPEQVGTGAPVEPQAGVRRLLTRVGERDHEVDPGRRGVVLLGDIDADPAAAQLPGQIAGPVLLTQEVAPEPGRGSRRRRAGGAAR